MPEETKEAPKLETIVGEMRNVYGLTRILDHYDEAVNPSDYSSLLDDAAQLLSRARKGEQDYNNVLAELEVERGSAYLKIEGSRDLRAQSISETYKARKDEIVGNIVEKLNKSLEGAKDKVDAIRKVSYAFSAVFAGQLPNITQEQADEVAKNRLMGLAQMPIMTKSVTGNPKVLRDMAYRELVNEFLVETEENETKKYSIDQEKIAKLADDVVAGSILYTAQPPKEKK